MKLTAAGPIIRLPAGQIRVRGSVERNGDRSHGISELSAGITNKAYTPSATRFDGGIDIPMASADFLAPLGQVTLSLGRGHGLVDRMPNLDRSNVTALWQPSGRMGLTGFARRSEELPSIELLAGGEI